MLCVRVCCIMGLCVCGGYGACMWVVWGAVCVGCGAVCKAVCGVWCLCVGGVCVGGRW